MNAAPHKPTMRCQRRIVCVWVCRERSGAPKVFNFERNTHTHTHSIDPNGVKGEKWGCGDWNIGRRIAKLVPGIYHTHIQHTSTYSLSNAICALHMRKRFQAESMCAHLRMCVCVYDSKYTTCAWVGVCVCFVGICWGLALRLCAEWASGNRVRASNPKHIRKTLPLHCNLSRCSEPTIAHQIGEARE